MSHQQSHKTGKRSDAQKRDRARLGREQIPASAPVSGAFGREGEDAQGGVGQAPEGRTKE